MNILYIIPYIPFPLNSGGNQAFFNMVNEARKVHQVSLLLRIRNDKDRENAGLLQEVWPDARLYLLDETATNAQAKMAAAEEEDAGLSGVTAWKCRLFDSIRRSMERKIRRSIRHALMKKKAEAIVREDSVATNEILGSFVREHSVLYHGIDGNEDFYEYVYHTSRQGFDLIQIEFYEYLPLVYLLPKDVKKVFVHHELHYVRVENEMNLFDRISQADRLKYQMDFQEELSALKQYDKIVTLTEVDRELLSVHIPSDKLYVSPALTEACKATTQQEWQPARDLVFIGGGDHFPNADGVMWLATKVLPALRQTGTNAKVYVVGKWDKVMQEQIHAFAPNIVFTGFVDNLMSFLCGKISVVPIRIGSGMRMKILDSINAGTPMVTTSKGCEGLPLRDGEHCFITDDATVFAQRIAQLMQNKDVQKKFVEAARSQMGGQMDGSELLRRRMALYESMTQTVS
jgi:glycosyltransferase involved in cell wall biosynthesis